MAWTSPTTRNSGDTITDTIWNTDIVDNLKETAPAKASAAGDVFYATAANAIARLAVGAARKVLAVTSGGNAIEWVDSLQSLMTAAGDLVYASAANTPARLAKGTDGQYLKMASGVPAWTSGQASVATGTYTGDGTTSQGITGLGFAPKLVMIWVQRTTATAAESWWYTTDGIVDNNASGLSCRYDSGGSLNLSRNEIISLDADGFTVDDDASDSHPNKNTTVYEYYAVGQ